MDASNLLLLSKYIYKIPNFVVPMVGNPSELDRLLLSWVDFAMGNHGPIITGVECGKTAVPNA